MMNRWVRRWFSLDESPRRGIFRIFLILHTCALILAAVWHKPQGTFVLGSTWSRSGDGRRPPRQRGGGAGRGRETRAALTVLSRGTGGERAEV